MFPGPKLGAVVFATLLCVSADFVLTPFDSNTLVSHRNRSSRSVRIDSDHETALLNELPEHGFCVDERTAAAGLVVSGGAAMPLAATVPQHRAVVTFEAYELVEPLSIEARIRLPRSPGQSRAPPAA
jgi:hypothetical protein